MYTRFSLAFLAGAISTASIRSVATTCINAPDGVFFFNVAGTPPTSSPGIPAILESEIRDAHESSTDTLYLVKDYKTKDTFLILEEVSQ